MRNLFWIFLSIISTGNCFEDIGFPVTPNQFPWYVVIEPITSNGFSLPPCGGTILSSRWILATASCGFNVAKFKIKFGATDYTQSETIIVETSYVIPHPRYVMLSSENNIALYRLEYPITLNQSVSPIYLPELGFNIDSIIGQNIYYVGIIADGRVRKSGEILRWSYTNIITSEECSNITNTQPSEMCSIDRYDDIKYPSLCHPIPGSPIAIFVNRRWIQIGISSLTGCNNMPSIFTKIPLFIEWILTTIHITELGVDFQLN